MKIYYGEIAYRTIETGHAHSTIEFFRECDRRGIEVIQGTVVGDALISRARSIVASNFLRTDADVLLTVDSDIWYRPEDAISLCEKALAGHDIIGAIYATRALQTQPALMLANDEEVVFSPESGPAEAQFIPTGFTAVTRAPFETLAKELPNCHQGWGHTAFWPFYMPFCIEWPEDGYIYLSEDWAFPLDPETPILDSAFRWRPLRDYRVGDTVIAIDEESPPNSARRYRIALVEGVIKKCLPAWRIVYEDGEFITTAEHPWLVKRAWRKAVGFHKDSEDLGPPAKWIWTPTAQIRPGDFLARVMPSEINADLASEDYRAGYLQGVMHGDGHVSRDGRQGTLAMADVEPLDRTRIILADMGLHTSTHDQWHDGNEKHRRLTRLTLPNGTAQAVERNMFDDSNTSRVFALGYLAGIYDAEGHYDGASVDIAQRDEVIRYRIQQMGQIAGFEFTADNRRLRLTGLDNVHRFWMATQPAMRRKMSLHGQNGPKEAEHRPVRVVAVEPLGEVREAHCLITSTGTLIADGIATHNCQRASDAGFKLWVDPSIRVGHTGSYMFTLEDLLRPERPLPQPMSLQRSANGNLSAKSQGQVAPEIATLPRDVAKRFGFSAVEELKAALAGASGKLAELWSKHEGSEESYYRRKDVGEAYILDLANWHLRQDVSSLLMQNLSSKRNKGLRVLDYGAGIGTAALMLADGNQVDCVEPNRVMQDFALDRAKMLERRLNFLSVPPAAAKYDLVVCIDVLEHISCPEKVAQTVKDTLKPGGELFTESDFTNDGDHPMHHVSEDKLGTHFWENAGMKRINKYWWRKP